jgi:hypothetical protein
MGGNVGVGSTSPWAKFSIHAINGETNQYLFAVSSSTASVTSNFFTIDNTGAASTSKLYGAALTTCNGGNVLTWAAGQFGCVQDQTSVGQSNPFFWSTNYGVISAATTSPFWAQAGVFASSTSHFVQGDFMNYLMIGNSNNSGSPIAFTPLQISSSTNNFLQALVQNTNSGNTASADYVVANDKSTDGSSYYGNFGINSSGYVQAGYAAEFANDVYLSSSDSNLLLEAASSTASIKFLAGGRGVEHIRAVISPEGRFGFGSTSPWAQVSIHGYASSTFSAIFAVGSSTPTATTTLFAIMNSGNVGIGTTTPDEMLAIQGIGTQGLLELYSNTGAAKFSITNNGLVGVGSTSPWGLLSVNPNNISGPSFVIGSSTATTFIAGMNGSIGVGTTSPWGRFAIEQGSTFSSSFVISNQGSSTPSFIVNGVNGNGRIGIGTTSPWATLSLISNGSSDGGVEPAFVIATTSTWTSNNGNGLQAPLFFVSATTTGALDYARVAIGATSTWASAAGLRDQFTVAGRIYQTWSYMSCDVPTGAGANTNALSADTNGACGNFFLDTITDGASYMQTAFYPPSIRLSPGIGTSFAANEGVSLRAFGASMPATSSPVLEVRGRITNTTSTSTMYIIGFSDTAANTTSNAGSLPANGVFFVASSSLSTWRAVTRVASVNVSDIDTGVSSTTAFSTGTYNRFRIEVASSTNTFMIDGRVVAVSNPVAAPYTPMSSVVFVVRNSGAAAAQINTNGTITSFDVVNMRAWVDDPPDDIVAGPSSFSAPVQPYDPIQGASLAEASLVDEPSHYVPGMLVSETTSSLVRRSQGRYDDGLYGVVAESPNTTLGAESANTVRVGIIGRVPVVVSLENGAIHAGDKITSSSVEGVGMRAERLGKIVGTAREDAPVACDASLLERVRASGVAVPEGTCLSTILVSLQVGEDIGMTSIYHDADAPTVDKLALTADRLSVSGTLFGGSITVPVAGVTPFTLGTTTLTATLPSGALTATGTVDLYKLATYTLSGVSALADKVQAQDVRLTSLEDRVNALETGSVSVSTSTAFTLSTSSLANALNALGAFIAKGVAQFGTLIADQFVAATNSLGGSSAGTVTLLAGNTVAQVNNDYVRPTSKIFVTMTASTTATWYITEKTKGSFKLVLSAPQTTDTTFDYFIVQTEGQIATSTPETPSVEQNTNDKTPPTITLLGENPVRLNIGDTFTDPGVSVVDEVDGTDPVVTYVNGLERNVASDPLDTSVETTYIITYTTTDKAGNTSSATRSVIVGASPSPVPTPQPGPSDTTPPVVTLTGSAAMALTVGDTFTDPGATAIDETDGDLTPGIVVTGSVDTATPGMYTLTYSATDAAGNTGSASRTVSVVAPPAP